MGRGDDTEKSKSEQVAKRRTLRLERSVDAAGNKVGERVNDVWRFAVYDAFGRLVAD